MDKKYRVISTARFISLGDFPSLEDAQKVAKDDCVVWAQELIPGGWVWSTSTPPKHPVGSKCTQNGCGYLLGAVTS